MRVVLPQVIPSSQVLVSPPELHPVWTAGSYSNGDKVYYGDRVYESQIDSNGDDPLSGSIAATPTWLDIGPSNKTAAFDQKNITPAIRSDGSDLVIRFKVVEPFTNLSLFKILGGSISVRAYETGSTTPYYEPNLILRSFDAWVPDWWDFFFTPWQQETEFILTDILPVYGAEVEIIISNVSPTGAQIGEIVVGTEQPLGSHRNDLSSQAIDFSRVDRDEFGNLTIIKRETAPKRSYSFNVSPENAGSVDEILRAISGRKTVFIADDRIPWLSTFGVLRDWSLNGSVYFDENGNQVGLLIGKLEVEGVAG